jgi:hypothetical protein
MRLDTHSSALLARADCCCGSFAVLVACLLLLGGLRPAGKATEKPTAARFVGARTAKHLPEHPCRAQHNKRIVPAVFHVCVSAAGGPSFNGAALLCSALLGLRVGRLRGPWGKDRSQQQQEETETKKSTECGRNGGGCTACIAGRGAVLFPLSRKGRPSKRRGFQAPRLATGWPCLRACTRRIQGETRNELIRITWRILQLRLPRHEPRWCASPGRFRIVRGRGFFGTAATAHKQRTGAGDRGSGRRHRHGQAWRSAHRASSVASPCRRRRRA